MPYLPYKDGKIYYEEQGSGGKIFIFVHGNIASLKYWVKLREFLPVDFKCYFLDLPGYGQSDNLPPYNINAFSEAVLHFFDSMNINSCIYVGNSTGGLIGMNTCLKTKKIEKIILVSTVPGKGYPLTDDARAAFNLLMTNRVFLEQIIRNNVLAQFTDEVMIQEFIQDALRATPQGYIELPESLGSTNIIEDLKKINIPALFLHGDEDKVIPLIWIDDTVSSIRGKLIVMKGLGHTPQLVAPQEVARNITNFVRG
ncbi:MAG: AB hydrolase superfamily protein YdjP [candidate division WS2 bacterium]|uniref:AB hydrolase superfamily protein YdjP n=1 Tax=Psychracetigena formicireducens TaxID=2986056 RepID=A0A9E2F5X9_PSYF1|nr:AB hydrolase superfamily protein YdjP [Candidatus Psychracetigena formicireducens]